MSSTVLHLLALTLTLTLYPAAAFFQLHADPRELTPEIGQGLRLECNYSTTEYVPEDSSNTADPNAVRINSFISNLAAIDEIRIVKQLPSKAWEDVFTVHAYDNKYEWGNTGNVKGDRGQWNVEYSNPSATFLVIEWDHAHEDQLGTYRCDIVGVDSLNEVTSEHSNEISVVEAALTPQGALSYATTLVDQVKVETAALRDENDDIDTEIASLGDNYDSIKREIETLKEKNTELQGELDTLQSEINALKADQNQPIQCSEVTSCLSSSVSTGK